jgi:hypothetical protein
MNGADSNKQLGISEEDVAVIRRTRDSNPFLVALVGAIVSILSFLIGFLAGQSASSASDGYPYSAIGAMSIVKTRRRRVSWLVVALIAVIAFASFSLGAFAADPPSYGVTTYYGVHGSEK